MKKLLLITAALAVCATTAFAGTPGVNLTWGSCPSVATWQQDYANPCDGSVGGSKTILCSFRAANTINDFAAVDAVIDIQFLTSDSPFAGVETGQCAAGAVATGNPAVRAGVCPTPLYDASTFAALVFEHPSPTRLRVRLTQVNGGVASSVISGQMYPGAALSFNPDIAANCVACGEPACMVLNNVTVSGFNVTEVESIETADLRNFVTYAGGAIGGSGCPAATPTKSATWGSVKSLYR